MVSLAPRSMTYRSSKGKATPQRQFRNIWAIDEVYRKRWQQNTEMNDARNGNSVDGLPAKGEFGKNEAKDEGGLIYSMMVWVTRLLNDVVVTDLTWD